VLAWAALGRSLTWLSPPLSKQGNNRSPDSALLVDHRTVVLQRTFPRHVLVVSVGSRTSIDGRPMVTIKPPAEKEAGEKASFGSGLGADFEPRGKRIVLPKARDGKPLKIKRQQPNKDRDS
jgi:hypothetical protein